MGTAPWRPIRWRPRQYGELVSQRRSGATSFCHFDALGSVRGLANSSEIVTDTRDFKAFGESNGSSGSTANRFWWIGRLGYYRQDDSSDYWARARVYRPRMGGWTSRDPLMPIARMASLAHALTYVRNNPVTRTDPSGLLCYPIRTIPIPLPLGLNATPRVEFCGTRYERESCWFGDCCRIRGSATIGLGVSFSGLGQLLGVLFRLPSEVSRMVGSAVVTITTILQRGAVAAMSHPHRGCPAKRNFARVRGSIGVCAGFRGGECWAAWSSDGGWSFGCDSVEACGWPRLYAHVSGGGGNVHHC